MPSSTKYVYINYYRYQMRFLNKGLRKSYRSLIVFFCLKLHYLIINN